MKEIEHLLKTRWAGRTLVFLDEVDSTNNEAKRQAALGAPHGTLVIAERQSGGKGRLGRRWDSPSGSGIWMSLLLRPQFEPQYAAMLTLAAALAVEEAVRCLTKVQTGIKWPNDIVADGRKLCGILTEMSTGSDQIQYVVIGIGINVNQTEFPKEIRETATSLKLLCGREIHRETLTAEIMNSWEVYYEKFLNRFNLSELKHAYNRRLVNIGKEVRVLASEGDYTGICRGIKDTGELLVELPDGEVREVVSGEVSVRGIYGYV